ncbi:MAG TPA: sigma-70 family RNA polymerase sigma factor [Polyangia bacterium]|nr:sigma-70 family RNA polymerase sigma factor [Polyangia bacterium]
MIIELCLAGESHHFRRLVERYQRGIVSLSYRMLGNRAEAEEMAQQSFVDAFTALRDYNPEYRFSSWLYRITINNCKDHLKSKKRTEQSLDAEVTAEKAVFAAGLPDPEQALSAREAESAVASALARLPLKYRTVLVLKDMEDLSYEEIRVVLKLPVTTLKIRVVRARKMLKDLLSQTESQP